MPANNDNELYDIYNISGELVGTQLPRRIVHRDGYWHKTIHLWVLNSDGELLLQKRSAGKDTNPNLWDISAAGHLDSGEDSLTAALRETREEIGLDLNEDEIKFLFTVRNEFEVDGEDGVSDREFQDVYLCDLSKTEKYKDTKLSEFNFDKDEITELKFVSINDLQKMVTAYDSELVTHDKEYALLFVNLLY